jgi:hypothetical protein
MNDLWPLAERFNLKDYSFLLALGSPWDDIADRALRAGGVVPQSSKVLEEVTQALDFQQVDFLLFSEGFGASNLKSDPLLGYIQNLPAADRRNFFVALISPQFRSGDLWTAFSYSVNLVLNPEDLPEVAEKLERSWSIWKDQYRVFLQSHK